VPDTTNRHPPRSPCRKAARSCVLSLLLCAAGAAILIAGGCAPKRVISKDGTSAAGAAAPSGSGSTGAEGRAGAGESTEKIVDTEPPDAPIAGEAHGDLSGLSLGLAAATLANDQIGKPYAFGGSGPERFDCSGLVQWVYRQLGVSLPRVSRTQAGVGRQVGDREAQPGDLLFFALKGGRVDHVGIYIGNGRFVHAPGSGRSVSTDSLNNGWWRRRLRTVRRVE
jgi:cell wall-associated NlpC family hydrolase